MKQALIKLGSNNPSLRPHIRAILSACPKISNRGILYHFTSLENALGILQSDTIRPTENFSSSFKARGMVPGVSLSRNPRLTFYGRVRLSFDAGVIRHRHSMQPFEFEPGRRGNPESPLENMEEYVQGPLKGVKKSLVRIDVIMGRDYMRNNGNILVEKFKQLVNVPVQVWEQEWDKKLLPASRIASTQIKWVLDYYDKGRGKILVKVNVSKIDRAWSGSSGYIPKNSYADPQNKLGKLRQLVEDGIGTLDAPSISYYEEANIFGVTDGRHRIALARELGLKTIKVAINPGEKASILSKFS